MNWKCKLLMVIGFASWLMRFTQDKLEPGEYAGDILTSEVEPICPKHNKPGFYGFFTSTVGCSECVKDYAAGGLGAAGNPTWSDLNGNSG